MRFALFVAAALCAAAISTAHAARPMVTDDAGTLAVHSKKFELGTSRDGSARAVEVEAGYGLIDDLELAVVAGRAHDEGARANTLGLALKWVPLQPEQGLAAGLRVDISRARGGGQSAREHTLVGLLSWRFAGGVALHANLGQRSVRAAGVRDSAALWAASVDVPLGERWQWAGEVFGVRGTRPGRQIGLRYSVDDGPTLSGALGRADGARLASMHVAWEF